MRTVIATDIFGKTEALEKLYQTFTTDYLVVDPYAGENLLCVSEDEAYECFMSECGIEAYARSIGSVLDAQVSPVNLLGFSVGASAILEISESLSPQKVQQAVGFYGSQIRHSFTNTPAVRFELFLPSSEDTFEIGTFYKVLSGNNNIVLHPTSHKHGFMNQLSKNFDPAGLDVYLSWLSVWAS